MVNQKFVINSLLFVLAAFFFVVQNSYSAGQVNYEIVPSDTNKGKARLISANNDHSGPIRSQDKLLSLLEASHILLKVEQEQLVAMVINLNTEDIKTLHEIASKLSIKVDKDKKMLKRLVDNIDKLIHNRYSKIVARVKDSDIKDAKEALFSFERTFDDRFIQLFDCKKCDNVENYKNIIRTNTLFLVENDEFVSIPELWDEIRLMVNVPYKRWSKKYNKLEQKLKEKKKDFQIYYESISFQETDFVKTFYIVKQLLKQITETDAPDFIFHERDDTE